MFHQTQIKITHRSSKSDYILTIRENYTHRQLLKHLRATFGCRFEILPDEATPEGCDLAIHVHDDYD
jgi:hypothetical protein